MILYGALHIVCQHVYVQSTALCGPGGLSTGIRLVLVSAQFMSYSPSDDQGVRGLLPTVCAYSFYVCRIQNSQVCVIRLCGPMSQNCIPAFSLQFMCITFLCMQSNSDYSI